MIISIASGKGGTGKTTIAANLALSLENNFQYLECDVEEPNGHIFVRPAFQQPLTFGMPIPVVDQEKCDYCGKCIEVCQFDAISPDYIVDPVSCEGCGVCVWFCPVDAIDFNETVSGQWFISDTRFGPLVHARLGIAE
jgi:MinD superfamily P-loop ATPase